MTLCSAAALHCHDWKVSILVQGGSPVSLFHGQPAEPTPRCDLARTGMVVQMATQTWRISAACVFAECLWAAVTRHCCGRRQPVRAPGDRSQPSGWAGQGSMVE